MAAVHETMSDLHSAGAIDAKRMRQFDGMCREPSADSRLTFEVFKDAHGEWRWHLRSPDGRIIAASGEGYRLKRDCLVAIDLVRGASNAAVAA